MGRAAGLVLMREAGGLSNDYLAEDGIRHGNPLLLASKRLYPQLKPCFVTHYLNRIGSGFI